MRRSVQKRSDEKRSEEKRSDKKVGAARTQRGFSFIEILVVMGIIAVLAGMAAVLVPQVQESARQTESANNLGAIGTYMINRVTSKGGSYKIFPFSGKNFTLAPIAYKDIDIEEETNLKIFFSPGDQEYGMLNADMGRYKEIDKKSLRTEDFHELTSYAGRRNGETDYKITPKLMKRRTIIMCDDDDGSLHHPGGLIVCWSDGKAHYMEWDELGINEPEEGSEFLGDATDNERLQALSGR